MASVLITSASRGLGLELVRQYAADGWRVLAACRDPSSAEQLQAVTRASGGRVDSFPMDVTDAQSIERAAAKCGDAVDVMINSAGIYGPSSQRSDAIDYDAWAKVFDVNTMGPLRVTMAFVEHLSRSQRKLVVTITSGMGSLADNRSGGSIAYRSSKAAVNMVMRCMAIDLAPRGIVCVLLNPGWVKTDMGGPNATLTATTSVTAMRRLIETLGPAHSGRFFNYDGKEYAW